MSPVGLHAGSTRRVLATGSLAFTMSRSVRSPLPPGCQRTAIRPTPGAACSSCSRHLPTSFLRNAAARAGNRSVSLGVAHFDHDITALDVPEIAQAPGKKHRQGVAKLPGWSPGSSREQSSPFAVRRPRAAREEWLDGNQDVPALKAVHAFPGKSTLDRVLRVDCASNDYTGFLLCGESGRRERWTSAFW